MKSLKIAVGQLDNKNQFSYFYVLNPFLKLTRPDPTMTRLTMKFFDGLYLGFFFSKDIQQKKNLVEISVFIMAECKKMEFGPDFHGSHLLFKFLENSFCE